jgi:NAD-dependent SIR2 family protein deacetylase
VCIHKTLTVRNVHGALYLSEFKLTLTIFNFSTSLGLEEEAGVSTKKICYAHGSLHWASCCRCKRKVNTKEIESNILNGTVPYCQEPVTTSPPNASAIIQPREPSARVAAASFRKRSRSINYTSDEEDEENNYKHHTMGKNGETVCGGIMKPGITFFGEALHNAVKNKLESDRDKVDALIVIGTSLSV